MKEEKRKEILGDLGLIDELIELLKQLTSIESHAFSSYVSTKEDKFLKISSKVRELRTKYLSLIAKNEGQGWCLSKHLIESMMRLQECYTRFISTGQLEEAKICSEDYFDLYALFLLLNNLDKEVKTKSSA